MCVYLLSGSDALGGGERVLIQESVCIVCVSFEISVLLCFILFQTRISGLRRVRSLRQDHLRDLPILVCVVGQISPHNERDHLVVELLHGNVQGIGLALQIDQNRCVHAMQVKIKKCP